MRFVIPKAFKIHLFGTEAKHNGADRQILPRISFLQYSKSFGLQFVSSDSANNSFLNEGVQIRRVQRQKISPQYVDHAVNELDELEMCPACTLWEVQALSA